MSLSFCVRDIAEGRVAIDDVAFLTTGTCARTPADWEEVFATYRSVYWRRCAQEAEAIARQLIAEGRILQPRLEDQAPLFGQHSRRAALAKAERDGTLPDYWLPLDEAAVLARGH